MQHRKLPILILLTFVAGCTHQKLKPDTNVVLEGDPLKETRSTLLNIGEGPSLRPVTFDWPRDTAGVPVTKNGPECVQPLETAQAAPAASVTSSCLVYPIDQKSNLYIGLSYDQWLVYQQNLVTLDSWIRSVRNQVNVVTSLDKQPGEVEPGQAAKESPPRK